MVMLHRWGWNLARRSGPLFCAKFHPHWCKDKGIGPPKLKFLLIFDQNVEYKRPAGEYRLHDFFYKICRICTSFQDALAIKVSLDLLKGLWRYGGLNLMGSGYSQIYSALSGETMRQAPKRFRGARTCSRSSITIPSLVSRISPAAGVAKKRWNLGVRHAFLSGTLSVRHAFKRQSLFARFRHKGVGEQKWFWYRWIGEGL